MSVEKKRKQQSVPLGVTIGASVPRSSLGSKNHVRGVPALQGLASADFLHVFVSKLVYCCFVSMRK